MTRSMSLSELHLLEKEMETLRKGVTCLISHMGLVKGMRLGPVVECVVCVLGVGA